MEKLSKKQVEKIFLLEELPSIKEKEKETGTIDKPMIREVWAVLTDRLCKAGKITQNQYNNWSTPKICG